MKFIYSHDNKQLRARTPQQPRIWVMGLGSVSAYYYANTDNKPALMCRDNSQRMQAEQMRQLIHSIESEFKRQLALEYDHQTFATLNFDQLVTLTREVTQVNEAIRRESGLMLEGVFEPSEVTHDNGHAHHHRRVPEHRALLSLNQPLKTPARS